MSIKKKDELFPLAKDEQAKEFEIARRHFLKGLGAGALFFNPMLKSLAFGNTAAPKRVLFVFLGHGIGIDPVGGNGSFEIANLRDYLSPFSALANQFILMRDIRQGTSWGNAHDVSTPNLLTQAVQPGHTGHSGEVGDTTYNRNFPRPKGPSLDHILGQQWGTNVLRLSAGYTSFGMQSPVYFDQGLNPLPVVALQSLAFSQMSGHLGTGNDQSVAQKYRRTRVLNFLSDDIKRLKANLPSASRAQFDGQLAAIDQAYASLGLNTNTSQPVATFCTNPTTTWNTDRSNMHGNLDQYLSLIKLGFLCGSHNVACLGIGPEKLASGTDTWTWTDKDGITRRGLDAAVFGTNSFHHGVAHYCRTDENAKLCYEAGLKHINQRIAAFALELAAITDLNGRSVLDNTVIYIHGEVGDGAHARNVVNQIILGGSTHLRTGRFMDFGANSTTLPGINWQHGTESGSLRLCNSTGTSSSPCDKLGNKTEADVLAGLMNAWGMQVNGFGYTYRNTGPVDFKI